MSASLLIDIKNKVLFFFLAGFPKLLGIIKDVLIARSFFGLQGLDEFYFSFAVILLPLSFFSSSIEVVVIKKISKKQASIRYLLYLNSCFVFFILVLWGPIFYIYAARNNVELEFLPLAALMAYFAASGAVRLFYSFFQAAKFFKINFLAPIVSPLIVVVIVLLYPNNVSVLYISLALSSIFEVVSLGLILFQIRRVFPLGDYGSRNKIKFFRDVFVLSLASIVPSLVPAVEMSILSQLKTGVLSSFIMGLRFPSSAASIVLSVLSVVYFKDFVSEKNSKNLRVITNRADLVSVIFAALYLGFFIVASKLIVEVLYESERLRSNDIGLISFLTVLFAIEMSIQIMSMVRWRLLMAKYPTALVLALPNIAASMQILGMILSGSDLTLLIVYGRIIPAIFALIIYRVISNLYMKRSSSDIRFNPSV